VVAAAVVDLLRSGRTTRLPTRCQSRARARAQVGDGELRGTHTEKIDWAALTPGEGRGFLENHNEPPHQ